MPESWDGDGSLLSSPSVSVACPLWQELGEKGRREFWASLALRYCKGLGPRIRARLLRRHHSAYAAYEALLWTARQNSRGPLQIARELASDAWREAARKEWDAARQLNARLLLWTDPLYPPQLRELPDAPALLYCRGDTNLLTSPCIGVVGSRQASRQGLRVARHMAGFLASCGVAIVSGMACGVDAEAHAAALNEVGRSIGVLGTGIDLVYPRSNTALFARMEENGLLLSEFAPGSKALPEHFPIRNRIISGLSLGIVVVEAASRSGSLITARNALEQNREVYAVPGPALERRCCGVQELVRQGAHPVFSAEDILRDLADRLQVCGISRTLLDRRTACERQQLAADEVREVDMAEEDDRASAKLPEDTIETEKVEAGADPASGDACSLVQDAACPEAQLLLQGGEEALMCLLRKEGPLHVDDLARLAGQDSAALAVMLLGLEMSGRIRRLPGARYEVAL